jgi:hypothetical protein
MIVYSWCGWQTVIDVVVSRTWWKLFNVYILYQIMHSRWVKLMETVLVRCHVPYGCSWRQALQCSHTRHLRSLVVVSELPLSSRDMVTFRRSVGQNASWRANTYTARRFRHMSWNAKAYFRVHNSEVECTCLSGRVLLFIWHFLIVLITVFSVCSLRGYLPCPQRVSTDFVSFSG